MPIINIHQISSYPVYCFITAFSNNMCYWCNVLSYISITCYVKLFNKNFPNIFDVVLGSYKESWKMILYMLLSQNTLAKRSFSETKWSPPHTQSLLLQYSKIIILWYKNTHSILIEIQSTDMLNESYFLSLLILCLFYSDLIFSDKLQYKNLTAI